MVDGTCVSPQVADYVACVRAQGAKLNQAEAKKLSAEAGYAGANAKLASDVSSKLEREYTTSDANTLEVIKACARFQQGSKDGSPAAAAGDASRWGKSSSGSWWEKDGALVGSGYFTLSMPGPGPDATLEADTEVVSGAPYVCVDWRKTDLSNGYRLALLPSRGAYQIMRLVPTGGALRLGTGWDPQKPGYKPSALIAPGRNHVRVEIKGNDYAIFVNGQKLDTVSDANSPTGELALWVNEGVARFTNIALTAR